MMVCWMAQAIPPPLVHSHFVDIYLVRQDAAALLSSQKEHEQLFWHCAKCYWASVPVFFAQHFGFQQRGEGVPP